MNYNIFETAYTLDVCKEENIMEFQIDPTQKFMAVYRQPDDRISIEDIVGWYYEKETGSIKPLVLDHSTLEDATDVSNFKEILPKARAEKLLEKTNQHYSKHNFVNKIKAQYPDEVKAKMQQLSGLISDVGAAHIVANEKGIEVQ